MNNYYLHRKLDYLYHKYTKNRHDVDNAKLLIAALSELALDFFMKHISRGDYYLNLYEIRDYMIDFTRSYRDNNFSIDLINNVCYQFG